MHKYIGRTVDIIYQSKAGKLTQRRIQVWSVRGNIVKAFCLEQQGPRIFRLENILACQPVVRSA
jgi:predicted DNA-binding transcriptional regulator YafY